MLKAIATRLTALIAICAISIPNTGCTSQQTISELTAVLGNAASSIAALEGNPALAQKLKTDTATAVGQIAQWKAGTPAQDVIEALNLVEDDLNLIPGTSQYAPLVDLAIGTVESILALLPGHSTVTGAMSTHASRHRRAVTLAKPPKDAKEFKAQWNSLAPAGAPKL